MRLGHPRRGLRANDTLSCEGEVLLELQWSPCNNAIQIRQPLPVDGTSYSFTLKQRYSDRINNRFHNRQFYLSTHSVHKFLFFSWYKAEQGLNPAQVHSYSQDETIPSLDINRTQHIWNNKVRIAKHREESENNRKNVKFQVDLCYGANENCGFTCTKAQMPLVPLYFCNDVHFLFTNLQLPQQ